MATHQRNTQHTTASSYKIHGAHERQLKQFMQHRKKLPLD